MTLLKIKHMLKFHILIIDIASVILKLMMGHLWM